MVHQQRLRQGSTTYTKPLKKTTLEGLAGLWTNFPTESAPWHQGGVWCHFHVRGSSNLSGCWGPRVASNEQAHFTLEATRTTKTMRLNDVFETTLCWACFQFQYHPGRKLYIINLYIINSLESFTCRTHEHLTCITSQNILHEMCTSSSIAG